MGTNTKLPYNPKIAKKVRDQIRAGVPVASIFASIQSYQDAPGSLQTFYKLYREDMEQARATIIEAVGNKVVEQALEGDFKSQEFYLRSKGGWSPTQTIEEKEAVDEEEEAEGAVKSLMAALGKGTSEDADGE